MQYIYESNMALEHNRISSDNQGSPAEPIDGHQKQQEPLSPQVDNNEF